MENSYCSFLLRFITDIMEFYDGCYGTFLKDFIDSERSPKKTHKIIIFKKNLEKNQADLLRILRILRNITVHNISPSTAEAKRLGVSDLD
jgi:hypothetical protein